MVFMLLFLPQSHKKEERIEQCADLYIVDWAPEESEVQPGQEGGTTHLWEESWDDDDTSEDFSKQLK